MTSLLFTFTALAMALLFFAGILGCIELGWRLARKHSLAADGSLEGTKALEASLFGLLGLLLAFTFSGALSRFDSRRLLVVEETNIIGTAYLRLDLLSPGPRADLQKMFQDYLDLRIGAYRNLASLAEWDSKLAASEALQKQIWDRAVVDTRKEPTTAPAILLLPALNQMIDITTTRSMWRRMHAPTIIFVLLVGIALACSVVAGYALYKDGTRRWLHILGFAFVLAITFYVILDLEFPRWGFIRVDDFDRALVTLRTNMK